VNPRPHLRGAEELGGDGAPSKVLFRDSQGTANSKVRPRRLGRYWSRVERSR